MRVSVGSSGHSAHHGSVSEVSAAQLGSVSLPGEAPSPCAAGTLRQKLCPSPAPAQCGAGSVGLLWELLEDPCIEILPLAPGPLKLFWEGQGPLVSPHQHFGLGLVTQSQESPQSQHQ